MAHYDHRRNKKSEPNIDLSAFRQKVREAETPDRLHELLEYAREHDEESNGLFIIAYQAPERAFDASMLRWTLRHKPGRLLANVRLQNKQLEHIRTLIFEAIEAGSLEPQKQEEYLDALLLREAHQPSKTALAQLHARTLEATSGVLEYIDVYEQALQQNWTADRLQDELLERLKKRLTPRKNDILQARKFGLQEQLTQHPDATTEDMVHWYNLLPTRSVLEVLRHNCQTSDLEEFLQQPGVGEMVRDWMTAVSPNIESWDTGISPRGWGPLLTHLVEHPHPEVVDPGKVLEWAQRYGHHYFNRVWKKPEVARRYARQGGDTLTVLLTHEDERVREAGTRAAKDLGVATPDIPEASKTSSKRRR